MRDVKGLRWSTTSNGALTVCCLLLCLSTAVTRPVVRGHRRLVQDGTSPANPAAVDPAQKQATAVQASVGKQNGDNSAAINNDFKRADGCTTATGDPRLPTASTSTPDAASRLCGWSSVDNSSCAFKNEHGRTLWYPDFVPGNWLHTPACSDEPFPADSATDGTLKSWGWERDGSLCAFKDDQQQPYPVSKDFHINMLAFAEAEVCTEDPEPTPDNSRPDEYGCLWGWQISRNCAFKYDRQQNDEPRYYKGYKRTCNLQANQERSIRFKKDPDGYIKTWYAGRKVGAAEESEATPVYDTSAIAAPVPVAHNRNLTVNEGGNITDVVDWSQAIWMNHSQPQGNPDADMADKANNTDKADTADKANRADKADTSDSADKANKTDTVEKANKAYKADKAANADTADRANKAAADAGGPVVPAGQKLSTESEGAQAHDFLQATFFNPTGLNSTVPPQVDGGHGRRHLSGNDLLSDNDVKDKKFPKGDPRDAQQGQRCSTVDPPEHAAASTFADNPCLPETHPQQVMASEGNVVYRKPVAGSSIDVTPPMKFGGKDGRRRPPVSAMIKVAQDSGSGSEIAQFNVGHTLFMEPAPSMLGMSQQRRHLLASVAVSKVVAVSAVASSDSDGHNAAVATATALSTGNHSVVAESYASNNSSANAEAVADGKNAVAIANATKGNCVLSVVVRNNKVSWHCVESASSASPAPTPHGSLTADEPASNGAAKNNLGQQWREAARCTSTPDQATSVQDSESRLWGYEDKLGQPCAYRAIDGTPVFYPGFTPLKWDTTPACTDAPTATNSMLDSQGRLWGFSEDKEENCAFKDASTGDPIYIPSAAAPEPDRQTAGPEVSPSAAGPSVNAPDVSNGTAITAPSGNITTPDKKIGAAPGGMEVIDNPAIQSAADAQAHAVTHSLAPNATSDEVALASAQAAIIYQMASEATTAQTSTNNVVKISEAEGPANNKDSIPQVLLKMIRNKAS